MKYNFDGMKIESHYEKEDLIPVWMAYGLLGLAIVAISVVGFLAHHYSTLLSSIQ